MGSIIILKRPCALDVHPEGDHCVDRAQRLLPAADLLQEVADELGGHHVLELNLQQQNYI